MKHSELYQVKPSELACFALNNKHVNIINRPTLYLDPCLLTFLDLGISLHTKELNFKLQKSRISLLNISKGWHATLIFEVVWVWVF